MNTDRPDLEAIYQRHVHSAGAARPVTPEDHERALDAVFDAGVRAGLDRHGDELRDKRTDLLTIRGILSPHGHDRVVPEPLGNEVAPAVRWLVAELEQLRAGLERAAGLEALVHWLVDLDMPGSAARRTVTLSVIIARARAALSAEPAGPSPLAQAEDAKRRRDLAGEIGALTAADAALAAQPWAPVRPGDVVLTHLPTREDLAAYGETYLAVDGDTDIGGHALLRLVSETQLALDDEDDASADSDEEDREEATAHAGEWSRLEELTPFYDLWFEAGPGGVVVIRAGTVVHGRPAVTR